MKNQKDYIFLLLCILLFSLTACKNEKTQEIVSEKEGMEYYQKGEYEKSLPLFQKAAESGNGNASYYLGEIYRFGKGSERNDNLSCQYYIKAAEAGVEKAYFPTGICYFYGKGTEKNNSAAFKWTKKAAEKINQIELSDYDKKHLLVFMGNFYIKGIGTLQDFSEAAKWFEQAAKLGDERAQATMAFFYYSGKGVLTSKEKAKYWAEKAAAQGDSTGQMILGMLYQYRENPNMKEAVSWYEKSSEQNNEVGQYQLGIIYENGESVKQDLTKAHHYYRLAAESGKESMIKALADFEARYKLDKKD